MFNIKVPEMGVEMDGCTCACPPDNDINPVYGQGTGDWDKLDDGR